MSYIAIKVLSAIKQIEIIDKKDFILITLNLKSAIVIMHLIFIIRLVYLS